MYMDIYDDKNIEWAFTTTPANTNGICHVQFRVIYEPKDFTSFSTTEVRAVFLLEHGKSMKYPCKLLARWCLEKWDCDLFILRESYDTQPIRSLSRSVQEGMQAILRDAYTWKIPQHQFGGIMVPVPLCTYTESDMKMALPQDYNIYYERKNHTVSLCYQCNQDLSSALLFHQLKYCAMTECIC